MVKKNFTLPLPGPPAASPGDEDQGGPISVDQALEIAGFGLFNALMLLYCGSLMLGMILETLGFSYVIPASRCDLNLSPAAQGWVAALPFAGFILTSHAWGWVADSYGRRHALAISTSVGAVFSLLSSLAPEMYSFVALRFCAALFIAGGAALGYTFLGEFSPPQHRDKMVALANASVALGTAVVPRKSHSNCEAVLPVDFSWPFFTDSGYRPWRLLVSCFAMPYAVCALAVTRVPESPKFLVARGRDTEALEVLRMMFQVNTGKDANEYKVKSLVVESTAASTQAPSIGGMFTQSAAMFRAPFLGYSLLLCFLQFVSFATSNGFYIWLPAVMNRVWNGDVASDNQVKENLCGLLSRVKNTTVSTTAGEVCDDSLRTEAFVVTIVIASFITVFTLVVAFSVKFFGKKSILFSIFAVAAAASFALHWTTDTVTSVLFFCSFQLCSTTIGLVNAFVVQIYPTQFRAMAVCVAMLMGRVGSMLFSKGIGTLLDTYCPACFFISSALLAASAALTLLLPGNAASTHKANQVSPSTTAPATSPHGQLTA